MKPIIKKYQDKNLNVAYNDGYETALKECLEMIDKCDINPCCHGLDKKEIIDKIKEKIK